MVAGRSRNVAVTATAAAAGAVPSLLCAFAVVALADTRLPGLAAQMLVFGIVTMAGVVASGWGGLSLARGWDPGAGPSARSLGRRRAIIAILGLLAIWTLTWSAHAERLRQRRATAVAVMTELVLAVRAGDASSYGLSREQESVLTGVRDAIGGGYQVSCPDFAPMLGFSFAILECHASLSGGGSINADVDSNRRRVLWVSVWAPSPSRLDP